MAQKFFSLAAKALGIVCGLVIVAYFINRWLKTDAGLWTGSTGSMSFLPAPENWQDLVLYVFMLGGLALVSYLIQKAIEHTAWLKAKPGRGMLVVVGVLASLGAVSWGVISYGNSLAGKNTGGKLLNAIESKADEATLLSLITNAEPPQTTMSYNALEAAAAANNLSAIPLLVQNGYNINAQSKELYKGSVSGRTVLMTAAAYYNAEAVEAIKVLLDNGAKPNLQDSQGKTALHYALENLIDQTGVEKIRLLLAAGAKADIADSEKKTPRDIARENFGYYPGSPEYYKEIGKLLGV